MWLLSEMRSFVVTKGYFFLVCGAKKAKDSLEE